MSYSLRARESAQHALKRIARNQIAKAIDEIQDREAGPNEATHATRKRCKKIRGLLRLTRPALGKAYRRENAWFRDTARVLAPVRDSYVLVETFDALLEAGKGELDPGEFGAVTELLRERSHGLEGSAPE